MNKIVVFSLFCFVLAVPGCMRIKHDITIQPIHVTMEITVKIDQALSDFFGDIDKAAAAKKNEKPVAGEEVK
jgi:hypothetical protein